MSTPGWLTSLGGSLLSGVTGGLLGGGLTSGGAVGGTDDSPTAAAATASGEAAKTSPGDPDVGRLSTTPARFLGFPLTGTNIAIGAAIGLGIFLIVKRL